VSIHWIELRFHEADYERTQEFILRWSSESGGSATEIVRQQWNFSPTGSTTEIEHYAADLDAVSVLELAIRPDLSRPEAVGKKTDRGVHPKALGGATKGDWREAPKAGQNADTGIRCKAKDAKSHSQSGGKKGGGNRVRPTRTPAAQERRGAAQCSSRVRLAPARQLRMAKPAPATRPAPSPNTSRNAHCGWRLRPNCAGRRGGSRPGPCSPAAASNAPRAPARLRTLANLNVDIGSKTAADIVLERRICARADIGETTGRDNLAGGLVKQGRNLISVNAPIAVEAG
jgi:hypothetical protein